jgi:hypothetical protein
MTMTARGLENQHQNEVQPPSHDSQNLSSSIWDDMGAMAKSVGTRVVDHEKELFNDVTHLQASPVEYVEAGIQLAPFAAAGAVLYMTNPWLQSVATPSLTAIAALASQSLERG